MGGALIAYRWELVKLAAQLTAWHDLFQTPTGGVLTLRAVWVSVAFALPPLIAAYVIFSRRDVAA